MKKDPAIINSVFPVSRVTIFRNGIQIKRDALLQERQDRKATARRPITHLSRRSLSRLVFVASSTEVEFCSMATLTYPQDFPLSGKASKRHLDTWLKSMQRIFGKMSYLWFLEFQKRGAPHYHVLLDYLEPNKHQRRKMAELWAAIVSRETFDETKVVSVHSHKSAWDKIKKRDGAKRYVAKYATKLEQKQVPAEFRDVGRFWGCSRDVIPKAIVQDVNMSEIELREWLYKKGHPAWKWDVIPKYLWDLERKSK